MRATSWPRPLIEDNSQRSQSSGFSPRAPPIRSTRRPAVNFDVFNLFQPQVERHRVLLSVAAVSDLCTRRKTIHFHPAEPRTARLALVMHY